MLQAFDLSSMRHATKRRTNEILVSSIPPLLKYSFFMVLFSPTYPSLNLLRIVDFALLSTNLFFKFIFNFLTFKIIIPAHGIIECFVHDGCMTRSRSWQSGVIQASPFSL